MTYRTPEHRVAEKLRGASSICPRCNEKHDPLRCRAHAKSTGKQCQHLPIPGGRVCENHGANAPQVIAKAHERLMVNADKASKQLIKLMANEDPKIQLQAAKEILDRAGVTSRTKIDVDVHTFTLELPTPLAES